MKSTVIAGIELKNAGYQPESYEGPVATAKEPEGGKKPERQYPTMYVDSKELPGIEKLKVGDEVLMVAKVRLSSRNERESEEGKGKTEERCDGTLKVLSAGFGPLKKGKKLADMTDEELAKGETPVEEDEE